MNFDFFGIYRDLAVNTYHVDPLIFVWLMIISVPFYYWGWFGLAKSVYEYIKKNKKNGDLINLLKEKRFFGFLTMNRIAWVGPYLYVVFFGENIPVIFWVIFIGWIFFSGTVFFIKLDEKIKKGEGNGKGLFL